MRRRPAGAEGMSGVSHGTTFLMTGRRAGSGRWRGKRATAHDARRRFGLLTALYTGSTRRATPRQRPPSREPALPPEPLQRLSPHSTPSAAARAATGRYLWCFSQIWRKYVHEIAKFGDFRIGKEARERRCTWHAGPFTGPPTGEGAFEKTIPYLCLRSTVLDSCIWNFPAPTCYSGLNRRGRFGRKPKGAARLARGTRLVRPYPQLVPPSLNGRDIAII